MNNPEQQPEESSMPKIRTMRTDAESYVKEKKFSTLQIATETYAHQPSRVVTSGAAPARLSEVGFNKKEA